MATLADVIRINDRRVLHGYRELLVRQGYGIRFIMRDDRRLEVYHAGVPYTIDLRTDSARPFGEGEASLAHQIQISAWSSEDCRRFWVWPDGTFQPRRYEYVTMTPWDLHFSHALFEKLVEIHETFVKAVTFCAPAKILAPQPGIAAQCFKCDRQLTCMMGIEEGDA